LKLIPVIFPDHREGFPKGKVGACRFWSKISEFSALALGEAEVAPYGVPSRANSAEFDRRAASVCWKLSLKLIPQNDPRLNIIPVLFSRILGGIDF